MATAVYDPIDEQRQERIATYVPPEHGVGTHVRFYPSGTRSNRPDVGVIVRTNGRTCTIQLVSGAYKTAVRFIDDPRLEQGDEIRAMGAWDFTEEHMILGSLRDRVVALEKRLGDLEDSLGGGSRKSAPAKPAATEKV